jgi:predicted PurR-regulated permease PerM
LLFAGIGVLMVSVRKFWREQPPHVQQGWTMTWLLGLPFFLVYFWSYSYHYRLGLTVMPLILAPIGYLLTDSVIPFLTRNALRRVALLIVVILLSLPALVAATYHTAFNTLNDTGVDANRQFSGKLFDPPR